MTDKTGWQPEEKIAAGLSDLPPPHTEGRDAGQQGKAGGFEADEELSTLQILQFLVAEGRDYATHEIQRQKLRATIIGSAARDVTILLFIALFLLMGALIAGLIGIIMGLAPLVGGPLVATGIVISASFLMILLLLLGARTRIKQAIRISFPPQEGPL